MGFCSKLLGMLFVTRARFSTCPLSRSGSGLSFRPSFIRQSQPVSLGRKQRRFLHHWVVESVPSHDCACIYLFGTVNVLSVFCLSGHLISTDRQGCRRVSDTLLQPSRSKVDWLPALRAVLYGHMRPGCLAYR
jgi:hypothetical protein